MAQPQPTPAVTATNQIAAGDKAARAKDFAGALTHYQAANQAEPSARAEMGVADALYNLGKLGESYETYADVEQTYGPKLSAAEKALVAKRMKEMAPKTGWLSWRRCRDASRASPCPSWSATPPGVAGRSPSAPTTWSREPVEPRRYARFGARSWTTWTPPRSALTGSAELQYLRPSSWGTSIARSGAHRA